jgi:hypothetical protein
VLTAGPHDLVRLDEHGAVVESRPLQVAEERWVTAVRRARLPDRDGSWLELRGPDLDGWWVAESSRAHVPGHVGDARLDVGSAVVLPPGEYAVVDLSTGGLAPAGELTLRVPRTVVVDRRATVDGRTFVRAAASEGTLAGAWVEVPVGIVPADELVQRITSTTDRPEPATLDLGLGDWTVFRFDERGRAVDRATVSGGRTGPLSTSRTLEIGGGSFLVVDRGPLAGWAVREDAAHAVTAVPPPAWAE